MGEGLIVFRKCQTHCESPFLAMFWFFTASQQQTWRGWGWGHQGRNLGTQTLTGAGSYYPKALLGQSTRQGKMDSPRTCPAHKERDQTANKGARVVIPLWAARCSQGWNVWKMSRLLASEERLPPVEERFQKLPILLLVPGPLPKSRRILVTSGKATFFPQQKQINPTFRPADGFQGKYKWSTCWNEMLT